MAQAQLTGLISRQTTTVGMTPKNAQLTWAELDGNFALLLDFVNRLGAVFNSDGTLNVTVPATAQIIQALLPFLKPVGTTMWSPVDLSGGTGLVMPPTINGTQNGIAFAEANGQPLVPTNYPSLQKIYTNGAGGYLYNWAGDNPTSVMRTPDLRKMFLRARNTVVSGTGGTEGIVTGRPTWDGNGNPSGAGFGGEAVHKLLPAEIPSHGHGIDGVNIVKDGNLTGTLFSGTGASLGTHIKPSLVGSDGYHNNQPQYANGILYIVAGYVINGVMQ